MIVFLMVYIIQNICREADQKRKGQRRLKSQKLTVTEDYKRQEENHED